MLRIKYFESFKNNNPYVVIILDKKGLRAAFEYFAHREEGYLNAPEIAEFVDIAPLIKNNLYLNSGECKEIARHFQNLYETHEPRHAYFNTIALGDDVEVVLSFGEYDDLF